MKRLKSDLLIFQRNKYTVQIGWGPNTAILVKVNNSEDLKTTIHILESWKEQIQLPTQNTAIFQEILSLLKKNNFIETTYDNIPPRKIRIHGKGKISDNLSKLLKTRNVRLTTSSQRIRNSHPLTWQEELVILTDDYVYDPATIKILMKANLPHLCLKVRDNKGVIGPLIIPGKTSCINCADLFRTSLDPEWPIIATQLSYKPISSNYILAQLVSLIALEEINKLLTIPLDKLNYEQDCNLLSHTLEVSLDPINIKTKFWPKHPGCSCSY